MRRLAAERLGDLAAYQLEYAADPLPGPGEVRLRVGAAAAGYVDGLIARGRYQMTPTLPHVPGGEIAGVVDLVGADVRGLAPGDRVVAWQLGGGFAELAIVPADEVDPLPDELDVVTAAAALVDYQTARYALLERAALKAGETVLVLGATGGVGAAGVYFAARAGARVIAAASTPARRESALAAGAAEAIDSGSADLRGELRRKGLDGAIDVIMDPVGGEQFQSLFRSLAKLGRHLVIGFAGGPIPALPANLALLKSASLVGVDIRHHLAAAPVEARATRQGIFAELASGDLKGPVIDVYPLARAGEALEATLDRTKKGKVVVQP